MCTKNVKEKSSRTSSESKVSENYYNQKKEV